MSSDIIGIFGLQGSGKTMLSTHMGKQDHDKGIPIFSNYGLKKIPYTPVITFDDIEKIHNGTLLIDEAYMLMYSRRSMKQESLDLLRIFALNRKRDIKIIYTTQLSRTIDVQVREFTRYYYYPQIRTIQYKNKTVERLVYYYKNIIGQKSRTYMLPQPLEYYGSFYDTKEEIDKLKTDPVTTWEKGIALEETFIKALKKIKKIKYIERVPRSGNKPLTSWAFDVIAYTKGRTYAFDVKGVNNRDVYFNKSIGRNLLIKINNAQGHNAIPFIVFPQRNIKRLNDPARWFIYPLTETSYLLGMNSDPHYNKLSMDSKNLLEFIMNK